MTAADCQLHRRLTLNRLVTTTVGNQEDRNCRPVGVQEVMKEITTVCLKFVTGKERIKTVRQSDTPIQFVILQNVISSSFN